MTKKRKKSSDIGASCFMAVFVYWWLYPLKWICYDLPVSLIHSSKSQTPEMPDIEYVNTKKYGDYAVTETGKFSKINVDASIEGIKKQIDDRKRICETTSDPLVFFYSYDFIIKRYIDIMLMAKYAEIPLVQMTFAKTEYEIMISMKQKSIQNLIERCRMKTYNKIVSLKTAAAKMKHADAFRLQFNDYLDEISSENQKQIFDSCDYLYFIAQK